MQCVMIINYRLILRKIFSLRNVAKKYEILRKTLFLIFAIKLLFYVSI